MDELLVTRTEDGFSVKEGSKKARRISPEYADAMLKALGIIAK